MPHRAALYPPSPASCHVLMASAAAYVGKVKIVVMGRGRVILGCRFAYGNGS
ncbi:hypothetical protein [Collimonas sp. OK242]|uniref:hypothetical protein n=1 Tax=Collimonas sp. OK242 TaxID=1798195 RepID=UPI0015A28EB2|nr:hypothetical protein [Collimonas sp. OK242]